MMSVFDHKAISFTDRYFKMGHSKTPVIVQMSLICMKINVWVKHKKPVCCL